MVSATFIPASSSPEIEGAEGVEEVPVGNIVSDVTATITDVSTLPYEEMVVEVSDKLTEIADDYSLPVS